MSSSSRQSVLASSVRRTILASVCAGVFGAMVPTSAVLADEWPSRPVTVISPYNPGGTNDIVARLVANHLGQSLGQPFVVENRAGAGGQIGVKAAIDAKPDGYTLLLANNGALIVQSVMRDPSPYDPNNDLTAIAKVADAPNYLGISTEVPAETVPEFLEYARQHPGALNYSSAGVGSFASLLAEALNASAGIDIVHVPSNGSAAALTELLAGRVHMMIDPVVLSQRDGDRVRVLATTHSERVPDYPEIPTLEEVGGPDLAITGWFGLLGPKDLPAEVVDTLQESVDSLLSDPQAQQALANAGLVPAFLAHEGFQKLLAADQVSYQKVKESTNLELN